MSQQKIKNNDWQAWIKKHDEWVNGKFSLRTVPKKYRILVALALSVAHWHPDNFIRGGKDVTCPLCSLFYKEQEDYVFNNKSFCGKCPLVIADQWCNSEYSLWKQWYNISRFVINRKEEINLRADKVYFVLMNLYKEEYERIIVKQYQQQISMR